MVDERRPMHGADHELIEKLRCDYPWHVEVERWRAWGEEGGRPTMEELRHDFNAAASWTDYWGTRTFGFLTDIEAETFRRWVLKFSPAKARPLYQPVVVKEEVVLPEPPPVDENPADGMEKLP